MAIRAQFKPRYYDTTYVIHVISAGQAAAEDYGLDELAGMIALGDGLVVVKRTKVRTLSEKTAAKVLTRSGSDPIDFGIRMPAVA